MSSTANQDLPTKYLVMTEFEPDAAGYARLIEQGDKTIRLIDKYNTRKVYRHINTCIPLWRAQGTTGIKWS